MFHNYVYAYVYIYVYVAYFDICAECSCFLHINYIAGIDWFMLHLFSEFLKARQGILLTYSPALQNEKARV